MYKLLKTSVLGDFWFCLPFDEEAEFEGGEDAGGADEKGKPASDEGGGEGARG
mgnify:CR=1